ncbi:hypothetical protein C8Q77DRAFT_666209 [Trametes polyzona]|nr:hypothetical protein C8Q77DRAFT_666209 [Trametes polyzona]
MCTTTLPIELFEHAIDFLHDEHALRATSLVCREWLPRSHLNLFRLIELTLPDDLHRFRDLISNSPHIADYVDEIHVSEQSLLGLLRPAMSIAAQLPVLLADYPRLRPTRLSMYGQLWLPTRYSPDSLHLLSRLSPLTSLDLYDVTFTTVIEFSIVLRALPGLKSLSAKHLDCQRRLVPDIASSASLELPSLTTLTIASYHPSEVVDWLIQYNSFPSLRNMDCCYELSIQDTSQALGVFWTHTATTLEHLSIRISKRASGVRVPLDVIEKQLDLSPCRTLRTLRFDCRQEREAVPDWTWLVWLLSNITCRTLRTLRFAFISSTHALASMHGFTAKLDDTLTEAPFSEGLEGIIFEFDHRDAVDSDEEQFLQLFPKTRARNLLRVNLAEHPAV